MVWHTEIQEDSLIKRDKIKKDLIKILKKHGFKRSFFKHPASVAYVKGDLKAKVYSKTERDLIGSPESGIPPYDYGVAGVEINGSTKDLEFNKTKKELTAYYEKARKEPTEKTWRKRSRLGIETRVGIFAAFIVAGVALSLGSMTITGNAVSNLTQTTPGLLGVFLFIAGLAGVFFCSRKK